MACISAVFYDIICRHGRLAERSKAAVLKTVDAKVSGGSNPSPSAIKRTCKGSFLFWKVRFSKSRVPNARHPGCTRLCSWHSLSAIAVRRIPHLPPIRTLTEFPVRFFLFNSLYTFLNNFTISIIM